MTDLYLLKSAPLPSGLAQLASAVLEECAEPQAATVSLHEVDEQRQLWRVEAIYQQQPDAAAIRAFLDSVELQDVAFTVDRLEQRDWLADALKDLAPVRAGRFYLYGSHDAVRRPLHGVSIRMDAGTAFGTGHHGTTRGCLIALDRLLKLRAFTNVLDVGCGTGVLAIAAALSGPCKVVAGDVDPEAVRVARGNARQNEACSKLLTVTATGLAHPAIRQCKPYDLVFANILARPLLRLAPSIAAATARNGCVVLSGITRSQEREVTAIYRACGLIRHQAIRLGDWSTLILAN